jgi:hypothetical protein
MHKGAKKTNLGMRKRMASQKMMDCKINQTLGLLRSEAWADAGKAAEMRNSLQHAEQ